MQVTVNGIDQADASCQEVERADAAVGDPMNAVGDLVVDVAGREDRPCGVADLALVEALLQTTLCFEPVVVVSWRSLEIPFCWW